MGHKATAALVFLLAALLLSACGSAQTEPVAADPVRPTFIFFFTDP
jgi:ABC-type glycerol-3-phosphate transport system substrate-binding protein